MPTTDERVGHIEVEVAKLQGQLGADLNHIDRRFDDLGGDIKELYRLVAEINKTLAALSVGGATTNQRSTTNEKIIFAIAGVIVSAVTFLVGKLL